MADKENIRKRFEREKSEYYDYALSEFLRELLEVLDNFERALESQDEEVGQSFREGVQMICKQYRDLLLKQGVVPIDIEDKKFDPHLHQAFMTEESDEVDEPEVSQELQKGYKLHNRLLRPSLVKVTVPRKDK
jgi:molecular chaperone GrpE